MIGNRTSWLIVTGAYLAGAAVPLLVLLQLASGYSSSFLGIWTPPNTDRFREVVGLSGATALFFCIVLSLLVVFRGTGGARTVAYFSGIAGILLLGTVAFNKIVNYFS